MPVVNLFIFLQTPSNQSRSRTASVRPVSNVSSTSSLNSCRSNADSDVSLASSVNSLDCLDTSNNHSSLTKNNDPLSYSSKNCIAKGNDSKDAISSDEIDYKKLCKQLLRENETLRRRIKELEEGEKKRELDFSREKRSLQRTISEQEEEIKTMNEIKADNMRLKDENAALIRVISKLSK